MTDQRPGLAPTDLAVDHALSRLAEGVRLLLEIEPQNDFRLQPVYKSGYRLLHLRQGEAGAEKQAA